MAVAEETEAAVEVPALAVLEHRYLEDALQFVQQIHSACETALGLLSSRARSDVVETIEFFVAAYRYKIEKAQCGIRKMFHLVWSKDEASTEGKSIKEQVLGAFRDLFLTADARLSPKEQARSIVKQLIQYDCVVSC